MQNEELLNNWVNLLKPLFPDDANIACYLKSYDPYIKVSWTLKSDPSRPTKQSKTIKIIIPQEIIIFYPNEQKSIKTGIDERLRKFIKQKLSLFNPNHDKARHELPPVETWIVPGNIIR